MVVRWLMSRPSLNKSMCGCPLPCWNPWGDHPPCCGSRGWGPRPPDLPCRNLHGPAARLTQRRRSAPFATVHPGEEEGRQPHRITVVHRAHARSIARGRFTRSEPSYELTPPAISGVMVELNQEVRKEFEALDNVVVLEPTICCDERVPGTNIQHRIDQFVIRRADGSVEPVRRVSGCPIRTRGTRCLVRVMSRMLKHRCTVKSDQPRPEHANFSGLFEQQPPSVQTARWSADHLCPV